MWRIRIKKMALYLCFLCIFSLFSGCAKPEDSLNNLNGNKNDLLEVSTKGSKEALYSTEPVNKYENNKEKSENELYNQAINYIKENRYPQAIAILMKLSDYKDSKDLAKQLRYLIEGSYISNGIWAVGAIKNDGRVQVVYEGKDVTRYNKTESWKNVKSISFRGGDSVEALTTDGKIITTSTVTKEELLNSKVGSTSAMADVVEAVSKWSNIKSFQTFYPQSAVAVTNDGFVYACYPFYEDGTEKLEGWNNIVSVSNGRGYVVGLKEDGTVKCNVYAYSGTIDTSEWKDIVAVSADTSVIGLKKDGTVVSTGLNRYGEGNVSDWTDIIAISTCTNCTLGLKSDGTVVAVGQNTYGQMDVTNWTDIVAIAAGEYFSIGLKSDGSMVLSGDCSNSGVKTPNVSSIEQLYVPKISINN